MKVRDNGRGLATNYTEGVGVGNTRARLWQLYGPDHEFAMRTELGPQVYSIQSPEFASRLAAAQRR